MLEEIDGCSKVLSILQIYNLFTCFTLHSQSVRYKRAPRVYYKYNIINSELKLVLLFLTKL